MNMRASRLLVLIVTFGLLLRIGLLYFNMHKHPLIFQCGPEMQQVLATAEELPFVSPFGFEISNIAHAIVCGGQGFASPFGGDTGPTAWIAPGPVMVYCLAFELFGCFSRGALFFLFGLSLVLSSAIILMVYRVSLSVFGNSTAALLAALVFAFSLQDVEMYFQGYQQDFNLNSFWFILVFYLFVRFNESSSLWRLVLFSVCAGIALLFIPVLAASLAIVFVFFVVCNRKQLMRIAGCLCLAVVMMACVIGPYILYQKNRTGALGFIKTNGAFEMYQGNSLESDGYLDDAVFAKHHPAANRDEFLLYDSLGEAAYVEYKRKLFREEFEIPRFLRTTAKRCMYFFFVFRYHRELDGLTFWMALRYAGYAIPGISLLLFALVQRKKMDRHSGLIYAYVAGYALPYLLIAVMYRYSFPINTLTSILLGYLLYVAGTALLRRCQSA
jgi:hypothetical protein